MTLDEDAAQQLAELAALGRRRDRRTLAGVQDVVIELDGQTLINFSSNDYLGLAGDSRLGTAARAAITQHGVGAGAARLIIGNTSAHDQLERDVAAWLQMPAVMSFSTGYAANVGVMSTLADRDTVVFSDQLNHASIIDGCRLSRATIVVYRHGDLEELERALRQHQGRRRIIVSETLFSMDGDVVDVIALAGLANEHNASLILDEAHAIGVCGPHGRGVAAQHGVMADVIVGTLGKAVGAAGAFAATTPAIAELLWNRARSSVFSTATPAMVAAAASAGIAIVRGHDGDELRVRLGRNIARLRSAVGSKIGGIANSPIIPMLIGDDRRTMEVARQLRERGLFVQGIRPPTVPEGTARLRITVSAAHTDAQVDQLAAALVTVA